MTASTMYDLEIEYQESRLGSECTCPICGSDYSHMENAQYCVKDGAMLGLEEFEYTIINQILGEDEVAAHAIDGQGHFREMASWDYYEILMDYSKKYPNWLFTLTIRGDEEDDIWSHFFMSGHQYKEKAVVQYPRFDPFQLH